MTKSPIHGPGRLRSLTAGAVAAFAAIALTAATAGPPAGAAVLSARTGPGPASSPRRVLLINGEQMPTAAAPGAPVSGAAVPAAAGPGRTAAASLADTDITLQLGGQAYVVPAVALPYLGHGLDPDLFRISALRAAEAGGTAGRVPVQMSYRGSTLSVPGVTITSSGAGTARGYLTAASASTFGAALARQYLADKAHGSFGAGGMFAGGLTIALAGPAASAAPQPGVTPEFPMSTLTVTGTDATGQPDQGDEVVVINADNSSRFSDPSESEATFDNGQAKFSVPDGHYWAVSAYISTTSSGEDIFRLDILPQFTVSGATTVATTAAAATREITMVTPRPASPAMSDFYLLRDGAAGPPASVGLAYAPGPVWVSPSRQRPTVGVLHAYAGQSLQSPPGAGAPYQYVLEYADPAGIIGSQRYVVRPSDVAAVDQGYYQTQSGDADWEIFGALPGDVTYGSVYAEGDLAVPGRDVLYAGGNIGSLAWYRDYEATSSATTGWVEQSGETQGFMKLPHGTARSEGWNQYPLHPDANANLDPGIKGFAVQPSATRSGNTLRIDTTPFSGNEPGETGFGFVDPDGGGTSTGRYVIDENGQKIASGNAVTDLEGEPSPDFAAHVKLSPKPSVVKVTLNAAGTGQDFPLSTASRTVWTWRSAHQGAATLPQGWYCTMNIYTGATTNNCAVQPMMTLLYDVHQMALDGSVPAGRQVIGLTVGHLQLAAAARITGATVSVSFDGGTSWHHATVRRARGGQYTAVFSAPAGAQVTLRTRAADAAGGSIAETITRAYQIAS